jgi:hypothetical protein
MEGAPVIGALVKAPQERVVVEDVPHAVVNLLEADLLTIESLGKEDLARVESEAAGIADTPNLDVTRVDRRLDAVGRGVKTASTQRQASRLLELRVALGRYRSAERN